jgi:hypothetical protein
MIDGIEQSRFVGPFRVADVAQAQIVDARLDASTPTVVGEHDGYCRLEDPVTHRRTVRLHDCNTIEIEDRLLGRRRHQVTLRFHLAPCQVTRTEASTCEMHYPGGTRLRICAKSAPQGMIRMEDGWTSTSWYQKKASPVCAYDCTLQLPASIVTHLRIKE